MGKKQKKEYKFLLKTDPYTDWVRKEEIGDGSFGKVYLTERNDGLLAACKVCEIENELDFDDMAQEVQILLTCDCPYVLIAYSAHFYERKMFMFLELCVGGGLDDVIIEFENGLYEDFIRAIMYQMFIALAYLHSKGIIHRDIKAGNMLLKENGIIKLADFGVSAVNSSINQKRNTFIGTPYWMAPEVIMTETSPELPYDYRSDVWSMGISCIEMAEAQPPNNEHHPMCVMLVILKNPPPTLQEPNKWSSTFKDFIAQCLTFDHNKRPTSEQMIKHQFLNISSESAKNTIIELYHAYKADVIEEEEDEETATEVDINIDDDDDSVNIEEKVSKLTVSDIKRTDSDIRSNNTESKKHALKTVKKTRKFQVNGELRTETVVTVVDSENHNKVLRNAKQREAGINEMKRLRRLEQGEMQKRKDFHHQKLDELETKLNMEKNKFIEKVKSELEILDQNIQKEFSRREMITLEEQKKFSKRLKAEMSKELKSKNISIKSKKSLNIKPSDLSSNVNSVLQRYKDIFNNNISSISRELSAIKSNLIMNKFSSAKNFESELWAMESRHLLELYEVESSIYYDLSALAFWQNLRQFKRELSYLKESFDFNLDEAKKSHALELKEMPKRLRASLKQTLEMAKKEYRKSVKNGLLGSVQSEKDYLKIIHEEEMMKQNKLINDFKSTQTANIKHISDLYQREKQDILNLQKAKQAKLFQVHHENILKFENIYDKKIRTWLGSLVERKDQLFKTHNNEIDELSDYTIKISVDYFN